MNHLKAQGRIKVRNEPWWWARVTLPCCRKSHNLKRRANWSGALLAQPEGRGGVAEAPIHCRETGPLFKGKQGCLSPPRPGRKVRAQNTNSSGNLPIFVANDRSASMSTKPVALNYKYEMLVPLNPGFQARLWRLPLWLNKTFSGWTVSKSQICYVISFAHWKHDSNNLR